MMVKKICDPPGGAVLPSAEGGPLSAAPCHCILFDAVSLWSLALADGSRGGSCQCDLRGALYFLMCSLTRPAGGVLCAPSIFCADCGGRPTTLWPCTGAARCSPWDLTALGTAAAVSGSYSYRPTWQMAVGLALIAG